MLNSLLEIVSAYLNYKHLVSLYCYNNLCSKSGAYKDLEFSEANNLYKEKNSENNKLAESIQNSLKNLNKNNPIKIKHPESIFGARVTTKFSKVDLFSCNNLTNIVLSSEKQVGDILTPFKFDEFGNSTLTKSERTYRIKRVGEEVYLVLSWETLESFTN